MPDPYWQWDWFLFNLVWLVPMAVYYPIRWFQGRRNDERLRNLSKHTGRVDS